jgi:proteic killer suppression protein
MKTRRYIYFRFGEFFSLIFHHCNTILRKKSKKAKQKPYFTHIYNMIQSFKCKETAKIFEEGSSRKFPTSILKSAVIRLAMINRSRKLDDLKMPPSNHLEKLFGDRKGQYSIRINDKYRICFRWRDDNAYDVEIVDYH